MKKLNHAARLGYLEMVAEGYGELAMVGFPFSFRACPHAVRFF
jgi:hypothetical protein